jgi:L-ascorbate metabolism protein UlaG (beta-lactamase superfamily)
MDPIQAAVAAQILGVGRTVPIHYDDLQVPPFYVQVDDPSGTFAREGAARGVKVELLAAGEALRPPSGAQAGSRSSSPASAPSSSSE